MLGVAPLIRQSVDVWAPQAAHLLQALEGIAFIAGGAARQIVMRNDAPPAADIDLFIYEERGYDSACRAVHDMGYLSVTETDHAAIFSARVPDELDVQVIRPFSDLYTRTFGTPEVVLDHFSFSTERFAIECHQALIAEGAIEDTQARWLKVHNVTDPVAVALRVAKYAAKGYIIRAEEMARLFEAWGVRHA